MQSHILAFVIAPSIPYISRCTFTDVMSYVITCVHESLHVLSHAGRYSYVPNVDAQKRPWSIVNCLKLERGKKGRGERPTCTQVKSYTSCFRNLDSLGLAWIGGQQQ